jgi:DNA-binding transcriptional regulator YiaG
MDKLIKWLNENTIPKRTSADIAAELGVSVSTVTLWRQGKRKPSRPQVKKLSRLTGIKVEDLL